MAGRQTGIFYMDTAARAAIKEFPKEFRSSIIQRLDSKFMAIFAGCALVLGGITLVMSLRPLPEVSEEEIQRIQERYAQLVLNQPKKEVKEAIEKAAPTTQEAAEEEEAPVEEEKEEVDREKETFVEKQQRKQATSEERRAKREAIKQQVESAGLFAAITAAGGSGGSSSDDVTDLLGEGGEEVGDLAGIELSKGTFAARKVDKKELKARQGSRKSGVDIEKKELGKAEGGRIASAAKVNVSSKPPEVSGDGASHADRSQSSIQRVINRQKKRLVRVYENWLKRDPNLGGQLKIKFTILPTGAVSNVIIVSSTTNNSSFDENIVRYVKRWKFSAVTGAGPVDVVYPFVFEKAS
jgi:TonB family protein